MSRKKDKTKLLSTTSQMLTDFQNSFAARLSGKFAKKASVNNSACLKYAATLPCEI